MTYDINVGSMLAEPAVVLLVAVHIQFGTLGLGHGAPQN